MKGEQDYEEVCEYTAQNAVILYKNIIFKAILIAKNNINLFFNLLTNFSENIWASLIIL